MNLSDPLAAPAKTGVSLRLMATSDLHMHILPYDYVTDLPSEGTGLARTAALIEEARAECANTLLFDNGDFLHGTPMGDELARQAALGALSKTSGHPIIRAMTRLGYDALALGNHDFDHGLAFLSGVLEQAPFPIVSSNLSLLRAAVLPGSETSATLGPVDPPEIAQPFALFEKHVTDSEGRETRITIGVLGFLPPGSLTGLHGSPHRAEIRDIVTSARVLTPHLRSLGADVVIALAHSGIGPSGHSPNMENAVVPLAEIDGIDAIVAGHAHQVFPSGTADDWGADIDPQTGQIHGTPVVAPGFWGSHLGIIDLNLVRTVTGRWHVQSARSAVRAVTASDPATGEPASRLAPEPGILRMMEALHDSTLSHVRKPVGETRVPLHSYFATVAPSPALDLVQRAMTWGAARHIAGTAYEGLPILASASPFKSGGIAGPDFFTDIAPGPLTLRSIADLYLYPNDLCALRLTGAELADWIERAAGLFNQIVPNQEDQPLLSPDVPAYGFEVVSGVRYEIDLAAAPRYAPDGTLIDRSAGRVRNLECCGAPLDLEAEVLLVTNSFRVVGGGNYPRVDPSRLALDLPVCIRDTITEYLAETGPYVGPDCGPDCGPDSGGPDSEGPDSGPDSGATADLSFPARPAAAHCGWRFSPVPGASVRFTSSPDAVAHLAELADLDLTPGAVDAEGFQCFSLRL